MAENEAKSWSEPECVEAAVRCFRSCGCVVRWGTTEDTWSMTPCFDHSPLSAEYERNEIVAESVGLARQFQDHISRLTEENERLKEVAGWAQATLTALNVGDVKSGSPLHLKLREVMIANRSQESDQ